MQWKNLYEQQLYELQNILNTYKNICFQKQNCKNLEYFLLNRYEKALDEKIKDILEDCFKLHNLQLSESFEAFLAM